jgi:hypothetical protein
VQDAVDSARRVGRQVVTTEASQSQGGEQHEQHDTADALRAAAPIEADVGARDPAEQERCHDGEHAVNDQDSRLPRMRRGTEPRIAREEQVQDQPRQSAEPQETEAHIENGA